MAPKTSPCPRFLWSFFLLVLLVPSMLHATINDRSSLHIGVLAEESKGECFESWRPTAEYLQSMLPGYFARIVCLNYDEVEKAVFDGRVDFTITNPAVYVNLEYIYGATRIATLKDQGDKETTTQYGGVLLKKSSRKDIQTVADLKGKRFAAVHEMSFGGWLTPWRYLKQHGIDPFKDFTALNFLGQHDRVLEAVRDGLADAGSIRTGVLERLASEGKINFIDFEVIDPQPLDLASLFGIRSQQEGPAFPYAHTTPLYPQWALAKIFHVDAELAEKVMFAFMQIKPSDKAALASHSLGWTIPLDYFPVHECLQDLKVGAYRYLNTPVTLRQFYQKYRLWVQGFIGLLAVILGGSIYGFLLNNKLKSTMVKLSHEHKEKERTVATLNEFKTTLDKTNDCVFIFDPRTLLFLYVNQGGLDHVGYSLEEMLTMRPTDIRNDITEQEYLALIAPLIDNTKNSIEFITRHKNKQGTLIPVEIMLQYVTLPDGKGRCVAIVRNITRRLAERKEREQLQARLLNEQKLSSVGQLAAGIAHEINTPTQYLGSNIAFLNEAFKEIETLIAGYDQLLTAGIIDTPCGDVLIDKVEEIKDQVDWQYLKEEIPKALSQSLEGITKVSSIVLAMKEFSHPGSKEKQLTDLNRLLETTVTIARNEWKYVAEIERNLDPHLPPVLCLPNEIGQVFLNILVNAAHAIAEKTSANPVGEKGRITLASTALADQIEITVSDTGCGIAEKIGSKIFDPFFTTKEVGRGTGQGLTISYDVIVKKHGGTIDFTSTEGKGTTFIIRLPIRASESIISPA